MKWVQALLEWYDTNRRDLPWRENKDPYRIWVSEIMLQQTRVEAVKPYFDNWMRQFPSMEDVARASEDEVVKAWQGLGYYSRARNLQLGLREVVEKYDSQVPRERKELEKIKGIGAYTAGAILSIAFNLHEVAVDGNVLRIFARLYNIADDILSAVGKKKITAFVEDALPKERPGDFNEALMDFGSAICIPKAPKCHICPLAFACEAQKQERQLELPVRKKKTVQKDVELTIGVVRCGDYYLLHKRGNMGVLRHMWEFPTIEETPIKGLTLLAQQLQDLLAISLPPLKETSCIQTISHVFSHLRWHMHVYGIINIPIIAREKSLPDDWKWLKIEDFANYPWAGPHGKIIEKL